MLTDKERRLYAARVADNINSIGGVPLPPEAHAISRQWVEGEISGEEMMEKLRALVQRPKDSFFE